MLERGEYSANDCTGKYNGRVPLPIKLISNEEYTGITLEIYKYL